MSAFAPLRGYPHPHHGGRVAPLRSHSRNTFAEFHCERRKAPKVGCGATSKIRRESGLQTHSKAVICCHELGPVADALRVAPRAGGGTHSDDRAGHLGGEALSRRQLARRRRHGRGLPGRAHAHAQAHGDQGAAPRDDAHARGRRALRARGDGGGAHRAPATSSRRPISASSTTARSSSCSSSSKARACASCSRGAARRSPRALHIARQIAAALARAHALGHRAPRSQARERHARRARRRSRLREGARLRHRQGGRRNFSAATGTSPRRSPRPAR